MTYAMHRVARHRVAVVAPVGVAALVSGNDAVAVINARNPSTQPAKVAADIAGMLHFQKLDLYQRAIEVRSSYRPLIARRRRSPSR